MSREELERFTVEQLLKLVRRQVDGALCALSVKDIWRPLGFDLSKDQPLITVGDFEIWPRFEKEGKP